ATFGGGATSHRRARILAARGTSRCSPAWAQDESPGQVTRDAVLEQGSTAVHQNWAVAVESSLIDVNYSQVIRPTTRGDAPLRSRLRSRTARKVECMHY